MDYIGKFSYVSKPGKLAPICWMDIIGMKKTVFIQRQIYFNT